MQLKYDASLDFISDANASWQGCKCNFFIYDANVLCKDENAKFIHDDASARIQTMTQIPSHRDGGMNVF